MNARAVVVVPFTIAPFIQQAAKSAIGNITVTYSKLDAQENDAEDEFDEDEQLYSAVNSQAFLRKYSSTEIPVFEIEDLHTLALIIPHFPNIIVEKLVAKKIISLARPHTFWLTLAPCQINSNLSVCRIDQSSTLCTEAPQLQPPHFITGICAAIVSELSKNGVDTANVATLVLNSEGQPGFEKIDADALMDAASQGASILVGEKAKPGFLSTLSLSVRKINSSLTSGMYI